MFDVYNSIRDTANLPPIIDGRHTLMLQERWEVGQSDRCTGVEFSSFHSLN